MQQSRDLLRDLSHNKTYLKRHLVEIMEIVSSQKRKPKIIRNVFIYVFQKDHANEVRSYECELRRKGQCKAKTKLDLGDNVIEHIHPPSQVKVELTKVKSRIKDTTESSEELPQRIIANELANTSVATMANFPRRENLGQSESKETTDTNHLIQK